MPRLSDDQFDVCAFHEFRGLMEDRLKHATLDGDYWAERLLNEMLLELDTVDLERETFYSVFHRVIAPRLRRIEQ